MSTELAGRTAAITGANTGLGYATAEALAHRGARIVLLARSRAKGEAALTRLQQSAPGAHALVRIDTSSLASVRTAASELAGEPIDMLINNAGTALRGPRRVTAEGHELHLATNLLGHLALTALLLPTLRERGARVVMLGSLTARGRALPLDDLVLVRSHGRHAYALSKLECIAFASALRQRSLEDGWGITATAAHPGWSVTDIGVAGYAAPAVHLYRRVGAGLGRARLSQTAAEGARPTVAAATQPAADGFYYGPSGPLELTGAPRVVPVPTGARDDGANRRLMVLASELAGVSWG